LSYITDEKGNWKRTVTCSHCYEKGHNRSGCSSLKKDLVAKVADYEKQLAEDKFTDDWDRDWTRRRLEESKGQLNRASNRGKNRKCSYCKEGGHTRRTCQDRKGDIESEAQKMLAGRKILFPRMEEHGVGVGALISYEGDIYTVQDIDWEQITQENIINENGHAPRATRPIIARSFPTEHYTRGRISSFALPDEVTNVSNAEISRWARSTYEMLSPAPYGPPADFITIEECRVVSKKLEIFNDGERPYKYMYTDD